MIFESNGATSPVSVGRVNYINCYCNYVQVKCQLQTCRGRPNMKISSYQDMYSHFHDKAVSWP